MWIMPANVKRTNLERSIADELHEYYLNKGLAIEVSANDVFVEQALYQNGCAVSDYCLEDCREGQFHANGRVQERHEDNDEIVSSLTIEPHVTFEGNFKVLGYDPIHKLFSTEIIYANYTEK